MLERFGEYFSGALLQECSIGSQQRSLTHKSMLQAQRQSWMSSSWAAARNQASHCGQHGGARAQLQARPV